MKQLTSPSCVYRCAKSSWRFFRARGLHGYTLDGKHLCLVTWAISNVLGRGLLVRSSWAIWSFKTAADAGLVIMGLNKLTGETVWRRRRRIFAVGAPPILIETAGRKELVVNGHTGVTAYDRRRAASNLLQELHGRGEPTITPAGELLCGRQRFVRGHLRDSSRPRGMSPDAHGLAHAAPRGPRYPLPIVIDKFIVVVDIKGIAAVYDSESGRTWKARLCDAILLRRSRRGTGILQMKKERRSY